MTGKENSIQLPPIESGRNRVGNQRNDPLSNLRNGGAAIVGTQETHDSVSHHNKYQSHDYQSQLSGRPHYVKGACYSIDVNN